MNRVDRFVRHLAAESHVPPRTAVEQPTADPLVAEWLDGLARQRGLAPVTIERHGRMLAQILPFIGVDPSRYTPRIIRDGSSPPSADYERHRYARDSDPDPN